MDNLNRTSSCLALTIRKEHRLMVAHNVFNKSARISWKVLFSMIMLNFINFFI